MKKTLSSVLLFISTLLFIGCGPAELSPKQQSLVDSKATMYTQVSMWTEKNKVKGTNYKKGLLIPINSRIKILGASNNGIRFEYLGGEITYATATKHTKVDTAGILDRIFAKTPVDISNYSQEVQTNIKNGFVVAGMTKEEVLLARGYPPFHQTISLKADLWKYWDHRFKTVQYKFKDNVVVSIVGGLV